MIFDGSCQLFWKGWWMGKTSLLLIYFCIKSKILRTGLISVWKSCHPVYNKTKLNDYIIFLKVNKTFNYLIVKDASKGFMKYDEHYNEVTDKGSTTRHWLFIVIGFLPLMISRDWMMLAWMAAWCLSL